MTATTKPSASYFELGRIRVAKRKKSFAEAVKRRAEQSYGGHTIKIKKNSRLREKYLTDISG